MHTASHLSSDLGKLGTAAQTAAVRRKHYVKELPRLLLHYRYMFGYVRERWIMSVKNYFSSFLLQNLGCSWGTEWGKIPSAPSSLLQAQSKPAWEGCCCCSLSHLGTVFTKLVPVWSGNKKAASAPRGKGSALLDTGALAEQEALQTNFGWWQEIWLKASWQRRAVSISMPGESSENATEANSNC